MAVHVLYNNTLKFYQSILMHQNMVQYQLDPTEQKNRPQLNPWSACYWKITNGHFVCIWNIKGTGLQAVWKKIDRSGPPSPKFSNHLTQSWTQFLKRKVHKVQNSDLRPSIDLRKFGGGAACFILQCLKQTTGADPQVSP